MSAAPTSPAHEDRALVEMCTAGDRSAQRDLFHQFKTRVHHTLYRILGPSPDLEDLIQESFVQVFRSLPSFRFESSLATWVGRITTRVALNKIRSRRRELPIGPAPEEFPSTAAPTEAAVDARIALASLYRALSKIDAKRRVAFALHVIDGRPMAEVAAMTGASVTAVKSQVHRARRELEKRASRDDALATYLRAQGVTR